MIVRLNAGPRTQTFEFEGKTLEVTYVRPQWRIKADGREIETRRLDDALKEICGDSRAVVKLMVEIMTWAES
jgi:hypothetical protein